MSAANSGDPVPLVDLKAQYASIRSEIDAAVAGVLERMDCILGSAVAEFETAFARYVEADEAVGVATGTDALELGLRAFGLRPGDEVIVPAMTFVATGFAVAAAEGRMVLADVDPETGTLSPEAFERAITPRTKAVIPVHLYGHPADMDPIVEVARGRGIRVLEDACQAHGARYKGKRVGSIGDAAAFSFYPGKNLGACGDGGLVTTCDGDVAHEVRMYRNYGQEQKYHHARVGTNSRLDTLQAAILGVKLRHLDAWNQARREHAGAYAERLSGLPLRAPAPRGWAEPVWHVYWVRTSARDDLLAHLNENGVGAGIHYPVPIHLQECFKSLGHAAGDFPVAEAIAREEISLPMFAELTGDQLARTVSRVRHFFETA